MIISNDNRYRGDLLKSLKLDERNHVEEPFLQQLSDQGWTILRLDNKKDPSESQRSDFSQVIIESELKTALKKINSFLTENQIDEVIRKLQTFDRDNLLENNQKILEYLIKGTTVSRNEETGEDSPTVRYIDFESDNLNNNSFLTISQFKVRIPGTENHIIPDIVLFINGIPIAVIECKSPKAKDSISEAIDQLMRYSQQRNEGLEGNQKLFYYNQIIVATDRQKAKFGTITTHIEKYFFRWTDPYPKSLSDIQAHEGTSPNDQQRLVAGMFDRRNLLDLIRYYSLFTVDDNGNTIKIVGRYQQFRAVKLAIKRLLERQNPRERGGIIWHTQGSGKSLTMMFMVREMRKYVALQSWKIVFITDRTQLEDQLSEASQNIGYTVKVASSIANFQDLLKSPAPDLIMGMIQKFQERELEILFPILNTSPNVLVMTDEAHRSQYKLLGANLRRGLPNATHIAYTGTPIDPTEQHYGDYIDKYTMHQSIEDGVTLKIVYEGRSDNAEVEDKEGMDKRFEDVFSDYNISERLQILGYGSRDAYLEARPIIEMKANDMFEHYLAYVFPNKLKAQVVAVSREAAIRYKEAFDQLIKEKIREVESSNPKSKDLEILKKIETSVIISHSHNDSPRYNPYTDSAKNKLLIKRYKMPYGKIEEGLEGNIGIIIVNEMLLTGFDAPIEQVMYLDRVVRDHNLLQAIARVNRVGPEGKEVGYVIDYVGIGHHIKRALDSYAEREQKEIIDAFSNNEKEINELIDNHRQIMEFLEKYKCTDFNDPDAFYDLFYDEDIRYEYILLFKRITSSFNKVLPHPKGLEFLFDYQRFLEINLLASKHLQDDRLSMKGIPQKLRMIADEYLKSKDVYQKIKPISILDDAFYENLKTRKRAKTKAAEIEHAIRHYIDVNVDDDPELFASFAKTLELILAEFRGNWDKIYEELEKLRTKIKNREKEETYGLHRKKHMPFFRLLKNKLFDNKELNDEEISQLVDLTQNIYNLLRVELKIVGFWDGITPQNRLKSEIQHLLLSERFMNLPNMFDKYEELKSRILEIAKYHYVIIIKENDEDRI